MAAWWTPVWVPTAQPDYPPEPKPGPIGCEYNPATPVVLQHTEWTCSCASSAWLLNSVGDDRLGRPWNEMDVVQALRDATYPGAVSPAYGLARADMTDLQTMFEALGYVVMRKQQVTVDDAQRIAGIYPMQINGARWYHHVGARELGDSLLFLANPAPTWRGVGQALDAGEAATWGTWNALWIVGKR
jgi:hypothetical protein